MSEEVKSASAKSASQVSKKESISQRNDTVPSGENQSQSKRPPESAASANIDSKRDSIEGEENAEVIGSANRPEEEPHNNSSLLVDTIAGGSKDDNDGANLEQVLASQSQSQMKKGSDSQQ